MKLKSIEMQGFKSFPDKTRISFDNGLTAVIGPNGSGKSNISDAVRWVLGEMSLKTLRGSKMEDVIFNGTTKRSAANYAYVSLYLDTTEEFNAAAQAQLEPETAPESETIPNISSAPAAAEASSEEAEAQAAPNAPRMRLSDEEEFVITRRYYRSGDSEYYINKKQVRLKDIYELFYDTGIGREGYSVIGQGKISEVLSVKGDERRSIFEEAAGISKFRYRKTEAERKLRDTEANLVRINDILSELESRVGPLEKEAENAKKYMVLSAEKKGLEITLWLEKADKLHAMLAESEQTLAATKLELELATAEIERIENENERFTAEGYALLQQKSALERAVGECEAEKSRLDGVIALLKNDIAHFGEKTSADEAEITRTEAAKQELSATRAELEAGIASLKAQNGAVAERMNALDTALAQSKAHTAQSEADVTKAEAEQVTRSAERASVSEESARMGALLGNARRTADDFAERLRSSADRLTGLQNDITAAAEAIASKTDEADGLAAKTAEAERQIAQLEQEKESLAQDVSRIKLKCVTLEQQREALVRLEGLFEGYSDAVRTVMRHASEGKILCNQKPVKVLGTVASLLSTEGEYVIALETALGASVQYVAVESEADAKAAIAHLKQIRGGRATFLPLDTVNGRRIDTADIRNMPGFIGVASELATRDAKYNGIAEFLLGRTVIAEDIDTASAIARKTGFRVRIVTKDGQVINAGGSYTGGSSAQKVGVFTRSMDIERLDKEIHDENDRLLTVETKKHRTEKQIASLSEEIRANAEIRLQCQNALEEERRQKSVLEALLEEEKQKGSELAATQNTGATEQGELQAVFDTLTARLQASDEALNAASARTEQAKQALNDARQAEADAAEAVNAFKLEQYRFTTELETKTQRVAECLEREQQADTRIAALRDEIASSAAGAAGCTDRIHDARAEQTAQDEKIAEIGTEIQAVDAKIAERDEADSQRRSALKVAQTRKEQAFVSHTTLDSRYQSAREEYDGVIAKLWDEYELTYSTAEEFRLPAEKMEKASGRLNSLKGQIRAMGVINVNAVEEYAEVRQRYDFLKTQTDDLNKTRRTLDNAIARLNTTMKTTFLDTFNAVNTAFNTVFTELFGGGSARLELTDPELPLECGIDIILHPPGKSVKSITLLSGGEQSFAAIALYLALQSINPAPFCIFDEIESALDDVNLIRFVDYVKLHADRTQYIMITHRRGTMERADTIYGVTMHEKGVSEYLRLDVSKLEEKLKEYTN